MDAEVIASQVVPYITAAVGAYGAAVLTRAEDAAANETIRLGQRLLHRLVRGKTARPGIEQAVATLATALEDPDFQAALRAQVKLAVRQDEELAAQIAALLPPPRATVSVSEGNARSVTIAGDVSGQVSTGDNSPNIRVTKRKFLLIPFGMIFTVTRNAGSAISAHPVAAAACTVIVVGGVTGSLVLTRPSPRPVASTANTVLSANPCPAGKAAVAPSGWSVLPSTTITKGADPGGICITSNVLYWAGIYFPRIKSSDYTVTVTGRSTTAWGVAARVSIAADGSVTGHAVQFEAVDSSYRDVDYPGDTGPRYAGGTNASWHTVAITVRNMTYALYVDGRLVARGTLTQPAEASGGALVRVWSGSIVEIRPPVIAIQSGSSQ